MQHIPIKTPEGVHFSLPLAGLVSRFLAWLIDALLIGAALGVLGQLLQWIGAFNKDLMIGFTLLLGGDWLWNSVRMDLAWANAWKTCAWPQGDGRRRIKTAIFTGGNSQPNAHSGRAAPAVSGRRNNRSVLPAGAAVGRHGS